MLVCVLYKKIWEEHHHHYRIALGVLICPFIYYLRNRYTNTKIKKNMIQEYTHSCRHKPSGDRKKL